MGKRYKTKDRERLVEQVLATGESVRSVAAQLGIREGTAYIWMKQARAAKATQFARLVPTAAVRSTLTVEVGAATIRLEPGFDPEFLLAVVSALTGRAP